MVRRGRWKLFAHQPEPGAALVVSMFDLQNDPGEMHDVAEDPEPCHVAVRAELLSVLQSGWDPARVREDSAAALARYTYLTKWADAVKPRVPETMMPPRDVQHGVEIWGLDQDPTLAEALMESGWLERPKTN
eukprot:SAG22_NODE_673_length_7973_cov_3.643129_2_plen_132_part_00